LENPYFYFAYKSQQKRALVQGKAPDTGLFQRHADFGFPCSVPVETAYCSQAGS